MAKKNRRWHGKLGGSHTTVIEAAWRFLPEIIKDKSITKISLGFITALKSSSGRNSVKIIDDKGHVLLSVRGAMAHQEILIFANDFHKAKLAIARSARKAQFHISFGSKL